MPHFDEKHVKICGGYIVWDGLTRPETITQGKNAGKPKWTLKVVFDPNNPDIGLFYQLSTKALLESKWRGQLPQGGRMPIATVRPGEFNDMFPGWVCISFKTSLRCPDAYDENGQLLDAMQYGPLIYGGQKVDVLGHCYEYDQAGNKGISAGLDGLAIIVSANAPRQTFGSAGVDTASAFGGGQPAYGQPAQPSYAQQPAQQPAYGQPTHQPAQQPAYSQPAPNYEPANHQPAPAQQPAYGQPAPQPAPAQQPAYGQPQQAHNFIPPGTNNR
jgi:hypothetical protein